VEYLPTFRLNFPDGRRNEYRLNKNQVELLTSDGTWRILSDEDLQLHHVLHTEVAKWLTRELGNANRELVSRNELAYGPELVLGGFAHDSECSLAYIFSCLVLAFDVGHECPRG